ncbi:hypothetical protein [Arthrobacter oryzae]|uniref:hypothetical protein n=1 Tax=Arthrobacter oryzae TaxID=409290 RepID=UPI00278AB982|nr:hypothetical protein [Arthrobacter oryzae]MDQ0079212.1 hypothetical protein [Arthrobacter oryzae]
MSVEPAAPAPAGSIRSRIAAHPVAAFLVLAIPLAWLAQFLAILLLQDVTPDSWWNWSSCSESRSSSRRQRKAAPGLASGG